MKKLVSLLALGAIAMMSFGQAFALSYAPSKNDFLVIEKTIVKLEKKIALGQMTRPRCVLMLNKLLKKVPAESRHAFLLNGVLVGIKNNISAPIVQPPLIPDPVAPDPIAPLVGGDRDEHGCIGSAGYQWSTKDNKCARPWEGEV